MHEMSDVCVSAMHSLNYCSVLVLLRANGMHDLGNVFFVGAENHEFAGVCSTLSFVCGGKLVVASYVWLLAKTWACSPKPDEGY